MNDLNERFREEKKSNLKQDYNKLLLLPNQSNSATYYIASAFWDLVV